MRDEIDQLRAFRADTPNPGASAWARAEQAITEARQQARGHRRTRWLPGPWSRSAWVAPLAAAAVIVLVAVASTTAGSLITRPGAPRPGASAAPARGASADSYAGVPPYYVAVASSSLTVVRATWTGATLARITTRTPVAAVAGAADGRTFVLDEQRSIVGNSVAWVGQPAFYLLRLTASGTEESLTRLAVPAIPHGTVVSGLALSPDGSKLAVNVNSTGQWAQARLMEIMTYTLATGASRSWTTSGDTNPDAPGGFTGSGVDGAQSISWSAGSTLAFGVRNGFHVGVRLLDTTARGSDLMADSRPVIDQDVRDFGRSLKAEPPYYFLACDTAAMISIDGSAIVCVYATTTDDDITTMGFARISTRTGKMNHVGGLVRFKGEAPIGISLYWVNSTGKIAIGTSETAGGGRVGVMNGDKFTPLPGVRGFEAIAW
jgi:hypothetical protein